MDIKIELEVKAKAFEIFKKVLNKNNTTIIFNELSENVIENTIVKNNQLSFTFSKINRNKEIRRISTSYKWFIPNKISKDPKLGNKEMIDKVMKIKFLKLFKPFLGELITVDIAQEIKYILNFNEVLYFIKESDYNKNFFYAEYAYKIYQLRKLNKELRIDQNITIFFDENILSKSMYNKIYNLVKVVFAK